MEKIRIRDGKKVGYGIRDGWKKVGSGMERSRIREKHPGSAALNTDFRKGLNRNFGVL
jgi:hypothetical protein